MARLAAVRMLVAVLLLCNAVASGVCAALCDAKVCCHVMGCGSAAATVQPKRSCCNSSLKEHCDAAKVAVAEPLDRDKCCAWIGKKADPAAALLLALFSTVHWVAVLPAPVQIPQAPLVREERGRIPSVGRGPPRPPDRLHQSRAPPMSSV